MNIPDRAGLQVPPGRRHRLAAVGAAGVLVAGTLLVGVTTASAEPATITGATFEWGVNAEVQGTAFFGGCNYLSAGESDGTESTYQAGAGDVAVVKDDGTPAWATKCELTDGSVNQKVVWSGGTGTVDPDTGEATLEFSGQLSVNFYGGLVPFTVEDPVLTVDESGDGQLVATLFGYGSSMDNPDVKVPLDPVSDVVVADLSDVTVGADGFITTPDYASVEYEPPAGSDGTPQDRAGEGWGSWPESFVDFHYETGLTSYWYSSGGSADPKKPPTAITVSYETGGGGDPEPGEGEQSITVTVPESTEPGEFLWSIDGDRAVDLGETVDEGTYLQATGAIDPISVTDTRDGGPQWSISGQVSDFGEDLPGSNLGWTPDVLAEGAGAVAGDPVASGIGGGNGLAEASTLASAANGHEPGSASIGADLDLRLPVETGNGTYTATLTITALS